MWRLNQRQSKRRRNPDVSWHCQLWQKAKGSIVYQSVYQLISEPKKLTRTVGTQPDSTHGRHGMVMDLKKKKKRFFGGNDVSLVSTPNKLLLLPGGIEVSETHREDCQNCSRCSHDTSRPPKVCSII